MATPYFTLSLNNAIQPRTDSLLGTRLLRLDNAIRSDNCQG